MTKDEELLVEQYFPYKNMDIIDRNFYLNLLLNSKEVTESEHNNSYNSPNNYDLVFMNLTNEGSFVKFDGAISNGEENKLYHGSIIRRGNKYFVFSNVYSLFELAFDDEKEYSVTDEFRFKDEKVMRRTKYERGSDFYESDIILKTDEEMEYYLRSKIGPIMKR